MVPRGRCTATLTGHTEDVTSLAVLPAGGLASGSADRTVKLWSLAELRCTATLQGHEGYVTSLSALSATA